jgi:NTE family protein
MPLRRPFVTSALVAGALVARALPAQNPVPRPTPAAACAPAFTALVLSGGGAKGFAHIGVIQILDSLGLKPDLIVGTSIGAIIGSMYAAGWSGAQIDSLTKTIPLERIVRRYEPIVSPSLGLLRPLIVFDRGAVGYTLQSGAIRENEVNAVMSRLTLHGNLLARGSFDSLPIPFRAIATEIGTRQVRVLATGDLARAVRASAAIPVVTRPVFLGKEWLTDGGIADNVPVRTARALGAVRSWVSLLPSAAPDPSSFDDPLAVTALLLNSLFEQDTISVHRDDVLIGSGTQSFENLDFRRATRDSLIALGRAAARAAFAKASCTRTAGSRPGAPRRVPRAIAQVAYNRNQLVDRDAVLDAMGLIAGSPVDERRLDAGLTLIGQSDRYRAVWLTPEPAGDDVTFQLTVDPAPARSFGVGVAFDQARSGRIWIGGVDRSLFKGDVEGIGLVKLGTYAQDITAQIRRRALVGSTFVPFTLGAGVLHESVRRFDADGELASAEVRQASGFVGLHQDPAPGLWRGDVGATVRVWAEPSRGSRGAYGLRALLVRARTPYEAGTTIETDVLNDYQRVRLDATGQWRVGAVDTRLRLRAGWGHRLPVHQTFVLGGDDGFAGERPDDIRGSQELFGSVLMRRQLNSILRLRLEVMAGGVGREGGFLQRVPDTEFGRIRTGVRVGIEAATPLGALRFEEGRNNDGRTALFFRIGEWF